jgi:dihydroflavonol-4-reductase
MAKIFITGSRGLVGRALIVALKKEGYEDIVTFNLPNQDDVEDEHHTLGNILDVETLTRAMPEGAIVIHLAALVSIKKSDDELMKKVNYEGTKNVVEVALKKHCSRFIYFSSSHVLGQDGHKPINEDGIYLKSEGIGEYEKSKKKATLYVLDAVKRGLPASIIYPSGIISDDDPEKGEITTLLYKLATGKLTYLVKGGYAFVDVKDIARGVLLIIKRGEIGRGYLFSSGYLSLKQIDQYVMDVCPQIKKAKIIPMFFVYLGLPFIMIHEKISGTKPLYTYMSLKTVRTHSEFDTSRAQKELGLTFLPLEASIKAVVRNLLK